MLASPGADRKAGDAAPVLARVVPGRQRCRSGSDTPHPGDVVHARLIATVGFLVVAGACASGGSATASDGAVPARAQRGNLNLITKAEIDSAPPELANAYELVNRLRPTMMRARGRSSGTSGSSSAAEQPAAYLDNQRLGNLDLLQTVIRASIQEIRYISATDAAVRWGLGHPAGVIQVITKR
jgi:hypothetical protein